MEKKAYESMIRVDHAGEFGAIQIYKGQLAVLKRRETKKALETMLAQEKEHFDYFDQKLKAESIRPTALMPLWRVMGFGMGAISGILGRRAAMACTIAVEEVIEEHYQEQLNELENNDELANKITEFQKDEIEHKEFGVQKHGKSAPFYPILRQFVRQGTKLAVFLSKKI